MKLKILALAGAATVALSYGAYAETPVNPSTSTQVAADDTTSKDAKKVEKAAGQAATEAGDEIDQASGIKEPVTDAEMRSAVSLSEVKNPSETLKTAEVKNPAGQALGEVNAVKLDGNGKVAAVNAEVGGFLGVGERVVSLDPSDLVYLKSRNLLVTKMSKDDLAKLPAVTKSD